MTETQVVEYNVTDAAIAEMSDMYLGLVITDIDDKEQFSAVHSARMVVRGKRIEVDKRRKELKADALAWGKKVQGKANHIFELLEPIETHLKKEEGKVQAEKDRIESERINTIREDLNGWSSNYSSFTHETPLDELQLAAGVFERWEITPEKYFEFTTEAYKIRDDGIRISTKMIEIRERLDREENQRKAEAETLAFQRKKQEEESARLQKKADEMAEVQRKMDEDRAKAEAALKAERDALEAEKKAEQDRKDREEFKRKAVERAKNEAIEKVKQDAIEMAEMAEAETAEKERQEALRPDKEKLEAWSQYLSEGMTLPKVESRKAKEIVALTGGRLCDVAEELYQETQKM
jgi:hypothetical protein